jgi:uncharacterized protein with ParB-like and HNH nuclease domain
VTFNEILGNGKTYKVPLFQRDYSWEEDNWNDLWHDLMNAHQRDEAHYMGAIVLQIAGDERAKTFWIINGQQRLTTLNILTLAIIKNIRELANQGIDATKNEERAQLLMTYIGQKNPASLLYSSKLFLNENNDGFYQRHLVNLRKPVGRLNDSEKLLWSAFEFYEKRVKDAFGEQKNGEEMANFLYKTVGESLKFIQITVIEELNAYAVFETLNSRGIDLTATDLLKNFLFMLVSKSPSDLQLVKEQWKKIIATIGLDDFPLFLRHFINTRRDLVSKDQLFKAIKQLVTNDQDVIDLLNELEEYALIYTALENPQDDLWKTDKETREDIAALRLFSVSVFQPLLMIVYKKWAFEDFKKVLKAVVSISFRYNTIAKLQTKDMERTYNKVAVRVFKDELTTNLTVIQHLKPIYLPDNTFRKYFELASFNPRNAQQKKVLRYILYKIEAQMPNGIKADYELDDGTIEHILPDSHSEDWRTAFSDDEHEKMVYLIGNLTLLEPSKNNKEAAQKQFNDKKAIYATSRYAVTNSITVNDWTPKTIEHRQQGLAKTAAGIWRVLQLS